METNKSRLIRIMHTECPLCDKVHEIEERQRLAKILIKGKEVEYEETYFLCKNSKEGENEFVNGKVNDRNLLNARNAYRKECNLLTSDEIVGIREQYGFSQVELARLLGWGEATISRYESKAIQDEAYDNMLRIVKDNPLKVYHFLKKNCNKFNPERVFEIQERVADNLKLYGRENIKRQVLESDYIYYQEPSDSNGYQVLDINKIESTVSRLAAYVDKLYKIKLMKMLWYTDSLAYQQFGKSITGLVYRHDDMGVSPIGHYNIIELENIKVLMEEEYDGTRYQFLPNDDVDNSCLSSEEKEVIDKVIAKFKNYTNQDIVEQVYKEKAYIDTKDGEIIPFSLAKKIRI